MNQKCHMHSSTLSHAAQSIACGISPVHARERRQLLLWFLAEEKKTTHIHTQLGQSLSEKKTSSSKSFRLQECVDLCFTAALNTKMVWLARWRNDCAAFVATVCVVVLMAKGCVCDPDGDRGVLDEKQLEEYYKKGLFMLESNDLHRCIHVGQDKLLLGDCERPTTSMLWKWASRQQLFNLGTSKCLGLIINESYPLGMFECDTSYPLTWWRCQENALFGPYKWKLAVSGSEVVPKKNAYHIWRRYGSHKEGPCSYPYEEIHTLLGNTNGMPCVFPFKYNNKWYTECTTEGREDHLPWCATSTHYDQDERWGFCPVQDSTCDTFWESNAELGACYQFNLHTIVTWSQAHSSCQAQGGNLLSITSLSELQYIRDRLATVRVRVWIGLNHLSDSRGWHWSDGSPLTLVNFTSALPQKPRSVLSQCGVFNPGPEEQWQGLECQSALPYICKKTPSNPHTVEPLENWQYVPTDCDDGWLAYNGHCYSVTPEEQNWQKSAQACADQEASLASLHSLSEVEFLIDVLQNFTGSSSEMWIGLWKQETSAAVEWSDGSPVTLTPWHQNQPPPVPPGDSLCATADRKEGDWYLRSCYEQYPAVCRKKGRTSVSPSDSWDKGCPEGWKRHGHHCYTVTSYEHFFDDAVSDYYCKGSLLTVENKFEQAFVNSLLRENGANSSMYYWIGLRDPEEKGYRWMAHNHTEVPLTFSNWNKHQPVSVGGCVAMSGGPALGHWEVKHCQNFKALSVCKRSIENYQEVPLLEDHKEAYAPCPPGWESQPGMLHCFKVFHDEKVLIKRSWVEADFFCQALGAKLASFQFYEEQLFVKHLLSTMFEETEGRWFWMGLNKRDPENPTSWQWSDDSPVVTSFIEDKNREADGDCAVFSHLTNSFVPRPCDKKYEWICKMYKGDQLLKPYWYTEQSEPWVFYRGAEYLLAKQPFSWDAVSLACQMMGSYLLSIHSREELHFIKERLRRYSLGPTEWWIGLTFGQPGTEAKWTDGTEIEFQNWSDGVLRIGNKITGMCATVSSFTGKWSVSQCSDLHGYVCKRRTVSVLETPREQHYIGACPEKWLYFGHKCLLLHLPEVPEDGKTWSDAESICSSFGGTLVAIENEIEQAYITMLLQGSSVGVWIGLKNDDTMAWTSGKAVTYTNWSPVEPRSHLTEDDWLHRFDPEPEPLCIVMSNNHNFHLTGKWYDEKCSTSGYGFVCQKPQDTTKPPTHSYRHPLSEKVEYRDHNYRVVNGNMSWYDAMQLCSEKHSDLVSITDAYHQAFLTVLVNRLGAPHWIGLYSQDSGINYQWSDGSDTVYTHWDSTDDEDDFINGDCVYIDVNGGWRRADCESTLPGALCHEPELIIKSMSTSEVACPSTWVKFQGVCYNFEPVVHRLPLEEAREHCRLKLNTSDILTIETETENRFVLEKLWSLGFVHQSVWLGMFFSIDSDSLNWVDGTPVQYTNWPSKPPDPSDISKDTCVTTKAADGVWYLTQCSEKLGFVCKTTTHKEVEVEAEPLNGLHHGVIAAAVLVAVVVFALLAGAFWFVYKRNEGPFRGVGSAYYRQTSSQATESDGNVLIRDLESRSGE